MKQTLERSIEQDRRLAMLVKQTHDAILVVDLIGEITFCNSAAHRLFRHQTTLLIGESLANLEFTKHRSRINEALRNCETIENLETGVALPSGEIIVVLFSITHLSDDNGLVCGIVGTLRDITKYKQAEATKSKLRETYLLAYQTAEVQETERRYLARELHDELGQCLTAIKTDAILIRNRSEVTEPKIYQSAQAIVDVTSHIYDVVHTMITQLRSSSVGDVELISSLQECIFTWQNRQPDIAFILKVSGKLDGLPETMNRTVFRIVQEAITNTIRHADASEIIISVSNKLDNKTNQRQLVIEITDNGKGMKIQNVYSDVGFGLLGMRERILRLGGTFIIKGRLGVGLKIHITIPLRIDKIV